MLQDDCSSYSAADLHSNPRDVTSLTFPVPQASMARRVRSATLVLSSQSPSVSVMMQPDRATAESAASGSAIFFMWWAPSKVLPLYDKNAKGLLQGAASPELSKFRLRSVDRPHPPGRADGMASREPWHPAVSGSQGSRPRPQTP